LNSEPKRYKIVSLSAKRSVLTEVGLGRGEVTGICMYVWIYIHTWCVCVCTYIHSYIHILRSSLSRFDQIHHLSRFDQIPHLQLQPRCGFAEQVRNLAHFITAGGHLAL
jgi:hypothetical protein